MANEQYKEFLSMGWPYNDTDKRIAERWKKAGRDDLPSWRTFNHIRYRLMFESDRFPTVESATREWFPTPAPLPVSEGNLSKLHTKQGTRFFHKDDDSVFDYREVTAMGVYRLWLDKDYDKVEELFEYFKVNKFTAIRVLLNLDSDYWKAMERHNSYEEGDNFWCNLVPFVNCAARYGLYTRLCLFGGVEPFVGHKLDYARRPDVVTGKVNAIEKMHAYVDQVVGTTRTLDTVLYEVANEPSQIGFGWDSSVVVDLGMHIHSLAPKHLMNFGCANDENSLFYMKSPASFLDEHLARNPEWDYLNAVKRLIEHPVLDQSAMPMLSGEWMNLGFEGDGTESTATAFATSAMLRLKHAIPAFHANCLLWGGIPDPKTDACVKAWTKGCDLVPINVAGVSCNGHWATSPFDADIFPTSEDVNEVTQHKGPLRVWGSVRNTPSLSNYIGLSIREPKGYTLVGDEDRTIETLHLEQWGDWQCRLVKA